MFLNIPANVMSDFDWYFKLWAGKEKLAHAGFGMGFERVVSFFLDSADIRGCTEFPRNAATLTP